jgi:hypothetical protein
MKTTTLYLTDAEMKQWNALPDERRDGWTVEAEILTSYESADVLKVRAGMARFDTFPALRDVVKNSALGQKIDIDSLKGMPEAVLPELCFTIGAVGMSVLIAAMFAQMKTDEDIAAIAGMSTLRHDILSTNASVTIPRR